MNVSFHSFVSRRGVSFRFVFRRGVSFHSFVSNECERTPSCTQCQKELDMLLYITSRIRPDTLLADVACCNATGRVFFRVVTFWCVKGVHFALLPIVCGRSCIVLRSTIEFALGGQCEVCISISHIPRWHVLASGSSEFMVLACKVSVPHLTTSLLSLLSRVGKPLGGCSRCPQVQKRGRLGIT